MIHLMPLPLSRSPAAELAGSSDAFLAFESVLHELVRGFLDSYRPEHHYMRGPGPRWRERHGRRSTADPHFEQGREQ
jgi:hypothetical protein